MALDPITAGMDLVAKIIERIFPDKTEQDKAKYAMLQLQEQGELQKVQNDFNLSIEQIKVNAVEAASGSMWVAGWRPGVGWVCVVALFYNYIFFPFASWAVKVFYPSSPAIPPLPDVSQLMPLLMALLGFGVMRSYDKNQQLSSPSATNPAPIKPGA